MNARRCEHPRGADVRPDVRKHEVVGQHLAARSRDIAFEVEELVGDRSRFVELLVQPAEQIRVPRVDNGARRIAVDETLAQGHLLTCGVARPHPGAAAQRVVRVQRQRSVSAARLDDIPGRVVHRRARACVEAVCSQPLLRQAVDVPKRQPSERIADRGHVAVDVVGRPRHTPLDRRQRIRGAARRVAVPGDRLDRPPQRVDRDAGRRIPVVAIGSRFSGMRAPGVVVGVVRVGLPWRRRYESESGWIVDIGDAVDDERFRAVGANGPDELAARVIEHRRLLPELRVARRCVCPPRREERLVFLDDASLVVVGLPAADDDVRLERVSVDRAGDVAARRIGEIGRKHGVATAEDGVAEHHLLGLQARLESPSEPVRVFAHFDRGVPFGQRHVGVGVVMNAPHRAYVDRFTPRRERKQVVLHRHARRRMIAFRGGLAANAGARDQPIGAVGERGAVAVRVDHLERLQHAVVVVGVRRQACCVADVGGQKVVRVVAYAGLVAQRVAPGDEEPAAARTAVKVVAAPFGRGEVAAGVRRSGSGSLIRVVGERRQGRTKIGGVVGSPVHCGRGEVRRRIRFVRARDDVVSDDERFGAHEGAERAEAAVREAHERRTVWRLIAVVVVQRLAHDGER